MAVHRGVWTGLAWRLPVVLAAVIVVISFTTTDRDRANARTTDHWIEVGYRDVPAAHANQGSATIISASGAPELLTRGSADIPASLARAGWTHVGDPDAQFGYLIDPYQTGRDRDEKAFLVTAPDGHRTLYVHALINGEEANNSFVAIAPDGQFLVSGEWGTMRRLLVFPTPLLNRHTSSRANLPLAAIITLNHQVGDVQGCDFTAPTDLVCATNDPLVNLWPVAHQLLQIQLTHSLNGQNQGAHVSLLASTPSGPPCDIADEVEGVDVHANRLTLSITCSTDGGTTRIYSYHRRARTPST